jgi:two-component system, OmpR family, sensor kinase
MGRCRSRRCARPATSSLRVTKRLLPKGLRGRLAVAISVIAAFVVGGSFLAIHQGTGSELQRKIDSDLKEQFGEFQQQSLRGVETPAQLSRATKQFIASQQYHPESRIFLVQIRGQGNVTNQGRVIDREIEVESGESGEGPNREHEASILDAPSGFANVSSEDAGSLRVYSRPIIVGGQILGTFRVADPRDPIGRAQSGLRRTFLLVGVLALAVSIIAAAWVATVVTRPLRRMAGVASRVDAGDLTGRIGRLDSSDEVSSLAESFDHMLERLEHAFERQREFVSDASHELRTPLTVLRGQIEGLSGEQDDRETRRRALEVSMREIDHMNRLVDDMLLLARAESGELVHKHSIVLQDFFLDLERDLPLFGERNYKIDAPREGYLEADEERLSQVLRNLVRNAVSHTEKSGRITVSATPRGDWLRFEVADDGPGISADRVASIFDRFYRTDSGRARDQGGSGLGLAIARAIVEAHGGRIWASSAEDGGASISFDLPGYGDSA